MKWPKFITNTIIYTGFGVLALTMIVGVSVVVAIVILICEEVLQ